MRTIKKSRSFDLLIAVLFWALASPLLALDGAPVSMAPAGPVADIDPEFTWESVPGAAYYRINVRNAANAVVFNRWFSSAETSCADGESQCRVRTGMTWLSASYRWKVIAKDELRSLSDWSSWLIFFPDQDSIPGPPAAPEPAEPSGMANSSRPVFSWPPADDVSRYRIQLKDAENKVVFDRWREAVAVGCSDGRSMCSLPSPKTLTEGVFRWKLLGKNKLSGKRSAWSEWLTFEMPAASELGSGLDIRPENKSCRLPLPPPRTSGVTTNRVFRNLPINDTVILLSSPHDTRWFSIEKGGRVFSFDAANPDVSTLETVLDITDRVTDDTSETGLLGMAFHPLFPSQNTAYLFYTNLVDGQYQSHLVEFSSPDGGNTLDPDSERHLLTLTGHRNHNHKGGTLAFGPDGYLYLGLGDGGNAAESQNTFSLFGTLLRIDVDGGEPYAIPPDNPFANGLQGAPEVYAYGFRNPWRWSIDPETSLIWLTDVGLSSWEEINIVDPGNNYGWPILEGPDCRLELNCSTDGLTPPVHAYAHDANGGIVVVGGFVYRGLAMPELRDTFIYADGTDRVWALFFDDLGNPDPELLIDGGLAGSFIRSMFQDEDGELYLVKGGLIYQLIPSAGSEQLNEFPATLSATGCVDPASPTVMTEGVIPYDINSAYWTDGAAKARWMALPDRTTIELDEDGNFLFPPGTVLIKEFSLFGKRVETRLFARHDNGDWAGYSYAWNEDETAADLVPAMGRQIEVSDQNYTIPSRSQCMACHTEAAGRALGPEVRQLNRELTYPATGRTANQLTTLDVTGLLDQPLADVPENLEALAAIDDTSASFTDRALSYLHSNCSSCHRPDGGGRGPADLRYQPLEQMNICDVAPEVSDLGIDDARLLAPGDPQRSIISVRLGLLGPGAMPPIGKNLVDIDAAAVVEEFIASVSECLESQAEKHSNAWFAD
jgi:uncharacterized repeat protein (TIGR03806 family)